MTDQPPPAIARYEHQSHLATTQAIVPVTIHLTAYHAAQLLVADYGRLHTAQMSPAERARALSHSVEERCMIDTTQSDIAHVRDILVGDMGTPAPTHYDGPTELSSVPSVFEEQEHMQTVTT